MKGRPLTSRRGGALLTAVILAAAVGIIVAHILSTSMLEKELTVRSVARLQADNVAEMVVDYGLSEIAARFNENSAFAQDEFSASKNPLELRAELTDQITGMGIDTDSLFLTAGKFSNRVRYFIDPADPANTFDPHKGMNVYVRMLDLLGRATLVHPHFGNYTSYVRMSVQVRDAPLFAYATFYNMDLEFHNSGAIRITGPVHANGTIWLSSNNALNFEGTLTATEDIRIGMKVAGYETDWGALGKTGTNVLFRNAAGGWQNLYRGSGGTSVLDSYYTSLSPDGFFSDLGYENWREYATNEFGGNLQSSAHGIPRAAPSGVQPYVPDEDGFTEKENHGYSLIEPNLPTSSPYHKGTAEREKFARKAGLIIRLHRDVVDNDTGLPSTNGPSHNAYWPGDGFDDDRGWIWVPSLGLRLRSRPSINDGWSSASRTRYDYYLAIPDDDEDAAVDAAAPAPGSDFDTGYYLSFAMLERATQTDPMSALDLSVDHGTGYDEVSEVALQIQSAVYNAPNDGENESAGDLLRAQFDEAFAAHPFLYETDDSTDYNGDGDTADIIDGMIDQRIKDTNGSSGGPSRLNLVEVNLAALANILEDEEHALFSNYVPPNYFNGVVYVEIPTDTNVTPRAKDKVVHGVEKLALVLTEGGGADPALGRVPHPAYNQVQGREEGFTLATNAPVYTRGHINTDGNLATGSSTQTDDPDAPNPPMALAADAITFLSGAWQFENSKNRLTSSTSTEVCTALLTGQVPTNEGGRNVRSGGNHNYLRMLEGWPGTTLRFRGSMVCAFESEIQDQSWNSDYYNSPFRDYGFYNSFKAGDLPPGTPTYASFRKSAFEFLTADEFQSGIDSIGWSVTVPALP